MVKVGALRAPTLTQLRGHDTHALCGPCVTRSRVGTHRSGAQNPRNTLFKVRNIQELSVGDTLVGDTSILHGSRAHPEDEMFKDESFTGAPRGQNV